jgi:hypothetical protein
MGEWVSTADWSQCAQMARPGIVFEIRNKDGQSLFTRCTVTLPEAPFDWKSPPAQFRAVVEQPPQHSGPMPRPPQP